MKFEATPIRCVYNTDSFKVYACDISISKYPNVKLNNYGNVTISGTCPDLNLDMTYDIDGVEEKSKYGWGYKIKYIKQKKPMTENGLTQFLTGCGLSFAQTQEIVREYPNIIDLVTQNKTDTIDINKLYNIGKQRISVIIRKIEENFMLADVMESLGGYFDFNTIKKLYDRYHSTEEIISAIKKKPYESLCQIDRIGFKTADTKLLYLDKKIKEDVAKNIEVPFEFDCDLKTSKDRCQSAVNYLLDENEMNGNTVCDIRKIRQNLKQLVPECYNHFSDICLEQMKLYKQFENKDLPLGVRVSFYIDKDNATIANFFTHLYETETSKIITNALQINNKWEIDVEKYRNIGDISLTDEQLKTLSMVCNNNISILSGFGGCVDCDTEFFNGKQWKRISEYQPNDLVLQYNQDGSATLVNPEQYIKLPCEKMYHFETKYGINQTVCNEHNIVYWSQKGVQHSCTIQDIVEAQNNNKSGWGGKFKTVFNYDNKGINLTDEQIRIMCAVICDGSFYSKSNPNSDSYLTCRFNIKKQRKKDRLVKLFKEANIEYREKQSAIEGYTYYYIKAPLRQKEFTSEWYNCSQHQLQIICDEILYWDGSISTTKNNAIRKTFSANNKQTADFIQFAFSACGYRTTIKCYDRIGQKHSKSDYVYKSKEYNLCISENQFVGLCGDKRPQHHLTQIENVNTKDGYKYCFVVPSHMLVLRRNNCIFITGNCGKSFSLKSLIGMLKDNNKSFLLCAPTGRASKVLSDYTGEKASTIHRLLNLDMSTDNENREIHTLNTDILIVDETSMCDLRLFRSLLSCVDFKHTKLLMVGDPAQLPSVGAGNILFDLINSKLVPHNSLTKVFRYGKGGILTIATDIRECKPYLKWNEDKKVFGDDNGYIFMGVPQEIMVKKVAKLYQQLLQKGYNREDILILSAYNKGNYGTTKINNLLQPIANTNCNSNTYFELVSKEKDKQDEHTRFYVNDMVIETKNNYQAKVCDESFMEKFDNNYMPKKTFIPNGEIGTIKKIEGKKVYIQFDELVCYEYDNMKSVKLAYSISVHKSQGGNAKIIILLTPKAHSYMLNSNLLYVGVTRASEKVIHFGEPKTINLAIKKKADTTRNTNLINFLVRDNKKLKENENV